MINNGLRQFEITLKEIAQRYEVHISTVVRWTQGGVRGHRLPSYLVGGRRYVNRQQLDEFMARGTERSVGDDAASQQRNRKAQQQLAAYGLPQKPRGGSQR